MTEETKIHGPLEIHSSQTLTQPKLDIVVRVIAF